MPAYKRCKRLFITVLVKRNQRAVVFCFHNLCFASTKKIRNKSRSVDSLDEKKYSYAPIKADYLMYS